MPIIFSWIVGAVFAGGLAFIVGKVALGLRADYLAIATLLISEIVIAIIKNAIGPINKKEKGLGELCIRLCTRMFICSFGAIIPNILINGHIKTLYGEKEQSRIHSYIAPAQNSRNK